MLWHRKESRICGHCRPVITPSNHFIRPHEMSGRPTCLSTMGVQYQSVHNNTSIIFKIIKIHIVIMEIFKLNDVVPSYSNNKHAWNLKCSQHHVKFIKHKLSHFIITYFSVFYHIVKKRIIAECLWHIYTKHVCVTYKTCLPSLAGFCRVTHPSSNGLVFNFDWVIQTN